MSGVRAGAYIVGDGTSEPVHIRLYAKTDGINIGFEMDADEARALAARLVNQADILEGVMSRAEAA